jgi:hypothetical protein
LGFQERNAGKYSSNEHCIILALEWRKICVSDSDAFYGLLGR